MPARRLANPTAPFAGIPVVDPKFPWRATPPWPVRWIALPQAAEPCFVAYRHRFHLDAAAVHTIHVTADERYELYLDGEFIGSGPERCDLAHWAYESYELSLAAGPHTLAARVWSLGKERRPWAQTSLRHGFLCASDPPDIFGTGVATWEAILLRGHQCHSLGEQIGSVVGVEPAFTIDAALDPPDWQSGGGAGWQPVESSEHGNSGFQLYILKPFHLLSPADLPPQRRERWKSFEVRRSAGPVNAAAVQALLDGKAPLTVPANATVTSLVDATDYLCAYPSFTLSGGAGARVELLWAEALVDPVSNLKASRHYSDELIFRGFGDTLLPDGSLRRSFTIPWWRSGRFLELRVTTADQSLILDDLAILETGYPFTAAFQHDAGDPALDEIVKRSLRTLYCCAHETYVDCPYYEQLQYIGDTRIQALCTYLHSVDDRLAARALRMFASGARNPLGYPVSNYPASAGQLIPPFALFFIAMLHDYALWRGRPDFLRPLMPVARATIDYFLRQITSEGLLASPLGWNYFDATFSDGGFGVPPGGNPGEVSAAFCFLFAYVLRLGAELEAWLGEPELAARDRRLAARLAEASDRVFYRPDRRLYADARGTDSFSEHTQILALLSNLLPAARRSEIADALSDASLTRANAYFTHYLFEVYASLGRTDLILARLRPWHDAIRHGFRTFPENWGKARSDCHAWNAHPLYHYFASILGIRPAAFGFAQVQITPRPGPLTAMSGAIPHPNGQLSLRLNRTPGGWDASIVLPPAVTGAFVWDNETFALAPGIQRLQLPAPV